MSLSTHPVRPSITVSDIVSAARFYEGTLGLRAAEEQADDSRIYPCGGGTSLHVYASPDHAGQAPATVATWYVADLDQVVDELITNGLDFEQYDDDSIKTNAKGIFASEDLRVAWFKDPDGNTFAIEQAP